MNSLWIVMIVAALTGLLLIGKFFSGNAAFKGAMAMEKIKTGATVIDVRTPAEFANGHYDGARNIPLRRI